MTRKTMLLLGLLVLMAVPIQGAEGVFALFRDVGIVHHIGGVAAGTRIVVGIRAKQNSLDLSCPVKVTVLLVQANNANKVKKSTFRRNTLISQVVVNAPFKAEAILAMQTQNVAHACGVQFAVDVDQDTTFPLAQPNETGSFGGSVESSWDDIPPDQAMPLDPAAVRQTGLP